MGFHVDYVEQHASFAQSSLMIFLIKANREHTFDFLVYNEEKWNTCPTKIFTLIFDENFV